jgi:hypothetical protein
MTPKQVAAVLMILGWLCLALAFLTSCVAVPVPPFGDRVGEMGTLHIRTQISYEPRNPEPAGDPSLEFAWKKFGEAKLLRDK